MSDKTFLSHASPVLAALNVAETVAFYEQKLGFTTAYNDGDYLIFKRPDVMLHLSKYDQFTPETNPFTCYIYVENIEPLYAEYQAAGVVHPNGALETKPWKIKEFAILDLNGNCIKFGELVD